MNDETYKMLREVARDIRQPALEAGRAALALDGVKKAATFLVSEVHKHGDISVARPADYAAALRAAERIRARPGFVEGMQIIDAEMKGPILVMRIALSHY